MITTMPEAYDISIDSHLRTTINTDLLRRACIAALKQGKVKRAQIELHVIGDKRMRAWNNEYLQHDYTTDVLSFDLGSQAELGLFGMLAVCRPFAQRFAKRRGISVDEELARYVVHGTLHLLGFDDHEEDERAAMWEVQEQLVANLFKQTKAKR